MTTTTEAAAPLLRLLEPQQLEQVPRGVLPAFSFHTSSSLPLDFIDLLRSLFRAMWNGILSLAAFFVSTSLLQTNSGYGGGMQMAAGQYLLGLGVFFPTYGLLMVHQN